MKHILVILILFATTSVLAKEKLLIISKEQEDFNKLTESLTKELGSGYESKVVKIDKGATLEVIEKNVTEFSPKLIVLMDNQSVTLAQEYYKKNPKSKIRSIALMGLNFKKLLKNNANICGIAYEVSAFSLLTQFRNAKSDKKLKSVLVFYRGSQYEETIKEAIELSKPEKIELTGIDVDKKGVVFDYLKTEGLKEVQSGKYEAVYVLLDSVLLEKNIFMEFWLPLAKDSKIPILIGTEKFVNPNFNFAVFGLSPNLKELASQAAQMIESLANGEKCNKVEDLIGVNGFWNLKKSEDLDVKLDEDAKSEVKILQ
ncbi:MAG: hypothetical protein ACOYOK_11560 [Pseudobdellovibrionaceae bacterium]